MRKNINNAFSSIIENSLSAAAVMLLLLAGCTSRDDRNPAKGTGEVDISRQEKKILVTLNVSPWCRILNKVLGVENNSHELSNFRPC